MVVMVVHQVVQDASHMDEAMGAAGVGGRHLGVQEEGDMEEEVVGVDGDSRRGVRVAMGLGPAVGGVVEVVEVVGSQGEGIIRVEGV